MAHRIDNRLLWLGFGVFVICAAYGVRYALNDILNLTQLEPIDQTPEAPPNDKLEDGIDVGHLKTLVSSPNYNISNSAIDIAVRRFTQSQKDQSSLLGDLLSSDIALSSRARTAVHFLRDHPHGVNLTHRSEYLLYVDRNRDDNVGVEGSMRLRRRRRREAMVLHEGSGELEEEDIIRPAHSEFPL